MNEVRPSGVAPSATSDHAALARVEQMSARLARLERLADRLEQRGRM